MNLIEKVVAAQTWSWGQLTPKSKAAGTSYTDLLNSVTNWIFIIAGIVAFFYLIYAGFIYLTAGGNPDAAKKGQQGIINAIIGLVIIILAFAIVRAILSIMGATN